MGGRNISCDVLKVVEVLRERKRLYLVECELFLVALFALSLIGTKTIIIVSLQYRKFFFNFLLTEFLFLVNNKGKLSKFLIT